MPQCATVLLTHLQGIDKGVNNTEDIKPELQELMLEMEGDADTLATRVVVVVAFDTDLQHILKAARQLNMAGPGDSSSGYMWIGNEGLTSDRLYDANPSSGISEADTELIIDAAFGALAVRRRVCTLHIMIP